MTVGSALDFEYVRIPVTSRQECNYSKNCENCEVFFSEQLRLKDEKLRKQKNFNNNEESIEANKLETMMCNGGMHKARLHVTVELISGSDEVSLTGCSELMFDRKRYGLIQIDDISSDSVLCENASLQCLTVIFEKIDITKSMKFEVEYFYVMKDKSGQSEITERIAADEICPVEVNGSSVCGVGPKGDVLKIFNIATSGKVIKMAMEGNYELFLKLRLIDNNGCIGGEANIQLNVYPHKCQFDNDLHNLDVWNASFSDHELSDKKNVSCFLCMSRVKTAREQYKQFSKNNPKIRVASRCHSDSEQQPPRKKHTSGMFGFRKQNAKFSLRNKEFNSYY